MISENSPDHILKTQLYQRGFLDLQLLQEYSQKFGKDLLQTFKNIVKARKGSAQDSLLKLVSLELSEIKKCDMSDYLLNLVSERKTEKTKIIVNILIPKLQSRGEIEKIRTKIIKRIRKGEELEEKDLMIVSELYQILNFELDHLYDGLDDYLKGQKLKQLKQKLTSLKKMIGDTPKLEEEQKEEKKKAYIKNLEIRQTINAIADSIEDKELQYKLKEILKIPKNKKWIGCRFYKLLIQQNWSQQQISTFSDALKEFINEQFHQKQKKFKRIKPILKSLQLNLRKLLEREQIKIYSNEDKDKEQMSKIVNSSSEIDSLISIDYSSLSINEMQIYEEGDYFQLRGEEKDQMMF